MPKKISLYVCSKPLQYFNVRNLPKNNQHYNVLIIEDKFVDAEKFYNNVKTFDSSWSEIKLIKDRSKIFFFCLFRYKVINFYYYIDFNSLAGLLLYFISCNNIFIYEEGISAYRTDIWENSAWYKRKIKKFLHLPDYAGHHPRIKGFFVYNKEKYVKTFSKLKKSEKLKPLPFIAPFQKMIENNIQIALKIFQFDTQPNFLKINNKKVLLYITTWPLNEDVLKKVRKKDYDYYIIKPHPQIKDLKLLDSYKSNDTIVIYSTILAEFLIKILIDNNNRLDIFHHNSSAIMYLENHQNIMSVINLNPKP